MNQNSNSTPPSSQDLVENQSLKPSPMPPEQTVKKEGGRRKRVPINFEDVSSDEYIKRFFSHVEKKDSGCWEWTAARDAKGYGVGSIKSTKVAAHRISLVMHGGIFTDEKNCACHHCDNPCCVNPEHLFAGSNKDNSEDRVRKKRHVFGDRMWSVRFPEKVPRGESHYKAKLTEANVIEIRRLRASGMIFRLISERFGVAIPVIQNIVARNIWKHVL